MRDVITYVGMDAHKKDLFIAMLVGDQATPVTWLLPNDRTRFDAWFASSSATRRVPCRCATKPGRAATPCHGR